MVQGRGSAAGGMAVGGGAVIKVIRVVTAVFAAVLALHIALVVFEVGPDNTIADNTADLADKLNLGIDDVFSPNGVKAHTLLNYGLAAVIWLLISAVLTKLVALATRAAASAVS